MPHFQPLLFFSVVPPSGHNQVRTVFRTSLLASCLTLPIELHFLILRQGLMYPRMTLSSLFIWECLWPSDCSASPSRDKRHVPLYSLCTVLGRKGWNLGFKHGSQDSSSHYLLFSQLVLSQSYFPRTAQSPLPKHILIIWCYLPSSIILDRHYFYPCFSNLVSHSKP